MGISEISSRLAKVFLSCVCFFAGGLRISYTIKEGLLVLLLTGDDKSSQDIAKAEQLLQELE
jgi:hypothetical protein